MLEGKQFPMFKIVQRPLLPVSGSWIDAAPFVGFVLLLALAGYFAYGYKGGRTQWARRSVQVLGAFFFVIFLHRCMCALRGWVMGMQLLGRNNLIAFGDLCMVVAVLGVTIAFGRLFCGWICPLGFMQEMLSKPARVRLGMPAAKHRNLVGYLVLAGIVVVLVWFAYLTRPANQFFVENAAAIWAVVFLLGLFWAVPRLGQDHALRNMRYVSAGGWLALSTVGVFVTNPWCVLFGDELDYSAFTALVAVVAATTVIPLAWCRYICPAGGTLALANRLSPFKVRNRRECERCGDCEKLCPTGALEPGSIDHSECIYCGVCVGHCGFDWEKPKQ